MDSDVSSKCESSSVDQNSIDNVSRSYKEELGSSHSTSTVESKTSTPGQTRVRHRRAAGRSRVESSKQKARKNDITNEVSREEQPQNVSAEGRAVLSRGFFSENSCVTDDVLLGDLGEIDIYDDNFWLRRSLWMKLFRKVMRRSIVTCFKDKLVHSLWKFAVKPVVDAFQREIGSRSSLKLQLPNVSAGDPRLLNDCGTSYGNASYMPAQHIKVKYRAFLESTQGFYVESIIYLRMLETKVDAEDAGFDSRLCHDVISVPLSKVFRQNICVPSNRAIKSEPDGKNAEEIKVALSAVLHSMLTQAGDIARYLRRSINAESYYLQAIHLIPCLGQPYNQLGILYDNIRTACQGSLSDLHQWLRPHNENTLFYNIHSLTYSLGIIYYYVRALCVPFPFPVASHNLFRLSKSIASKSVMPCDLCDEERLITLFTHVTAKVFCTLHLIETQTTGANRISRAAATIGAGAFRYIQEFRANLVPVYLEKRMDTDMLLRMTSIAIFVCEKGIREDIKIKQSADKREYQILESHDVSKEPLRITTASRECAIKLLTAFIDQLIEIAAMPMSSGLALDRLGVLPPIYVCLRYLILATELYGSNRIHLNIVTWINLARLLTSFKVEENRLNSRFMQNHATVPLSEETFLCQFQPLQLERASYVWVRTRLNNADTNGTINNQVGPRYVLAEKEEKILRQLRMVIQVAQNLNGERSGADAAVEDIEGDTTLPLKMSIKQYVEVGRIRRLLVFEAMYEAEKDDGDDTGDAEKDDAVADSVTVASVKSPDGDRNTTGADADETTATNSEYQQTSHSNENGTSESAVSMPDAVSNFQTDTEDNASADEEPDESRALSVQRSASMFDNWRQRVAAADYMSHQRRSDPSCSGIKPKSRYRGQIAHRSNDMYLAHGNFPNMPNDCLSAAVDYGCGYDQTDGSPAYIHPGLESSLGYSGAPCALPHAVPNDPQYDINNGFYDGNYQVAPQCLPQFLQYGHMSNMQHVANDMHLGQFHLRKVAPVVTMPGIGKYSSVDPLSASTSRQYQKHSMFAPTRIKLNNNSNNSSNNDGACTNMSAINLPTALANKLNELNLNGSSKH